MTQAVYLFNTLTRKKEKFVPMKPGEVGLYTCGPTVYHFAHIGNLRTYVFEDILVRTLRYAGFKILHVMNITDVGHLVNDGDVGADKMEEGAKREGKSIWEIADYYTKVFFSDLDKLNVLRPQIIPKATDHVPEMITMVEALEKKGIAYRTNDGMYFDTSKFPSYGDFAKLDVENLEAGKRVAVGTKRLPTDFALWKFSPANEKRQMEWPAPWGKGFPGWHIECSAMAMKYLGETFDIHCGGKDHIPVHHTNEIAQSEATTGKKFVNYWMHGAWLNEHSGKMSKSKGDFLTLSFLEEQGFQAIDYRFFLLLAHYRSEVTFHYDGLRAAQAGLSGISSRLQDWKDVSVAGVKMNATMEALKQKFCESIFDDLNTSEAMSVFFATLKDATLSDAERKFLLLDFDQVLGLGLDKMGEVEIPAEALSLVAERDAARKAKNWAKSDEVRSALEKLGFEVKDSAQGTKIVKK